MSNFFGLLMSKVIRDDIYVLLHDNGIPYKTAKPVFTKYPWLVDRIKNWKYAIHSIFDTGYTGWLKGDGSAYIDTEVSTLNVSKLEITFKCSQQAKHLCGGRCATNSDGLFVGYLLHKSLYVGFGASLQISDMNEFTWDGLKHTAVLTKGNLHYDNSDYTFEGQDITQGCNIYVYTINEVNHPNTAITNAPISTFKLYNGDNLIFWGIPYLENGTFGMLDIISNEVYKPTQGSFSYQLEDADGLVSDWNVFNDDHRVISFTGEINGSSDRLNEMIEGNSPSAIFDFTEATFNTQNVNIKINSAVKQNVLIYAPSTVNMTLNGSTDNVIKVGENSSICDNLVITDKISLYINKEFTATQVNYTKSQTTSMGSLVLPFQISKPSWITKFKDVDYIDFTNSVYGEVVLKDFNSDVLPANTPIFYECTTGTVTIIENNVVVTTTDSLTHPTVDVENPTMFGAYEKYTVGLYGGNNEANSDGLYAGKCYYVNDSGSTVTGNGWFNIGAFRAFIYRGTSYDN